MNKWLATALLQTLALAAGSHVSAQPLRDAVSPPSQPDAIDQLFRRLALDAIPHTYVDDDDWGKTKEFTTGLHVSREGLKVETRRRRRQLNHGRWDRFQVTLANEDDVLLDVREIRSAESGRAAFTVEFSAPLKLHVRRANWRRGVQLWSLSADASATINVQLECTAEVRLDTTELPPAIVLAPEVQAAKIRMTRFQLHGVSKLRGEVADELGDALRKFLVDKVASKDEKLVRKINERIAKEEGRLRLSLAAWTTSSLRKAVADECE